MKSKVYICQGNQLICQLWWSALLAQNISHREAGCSVLLFAESCVRRISVKRTGNDRNLAVHTNGAVSSLATQPSLVDFCQHNALLTSDLQGQNVSRTRSTVISDTMPASAVAPFCRTASRLKKMIQSLCCSSERKGQSLPEADTVHLRDADCSIVNVAAPNGRMVLAPEP